MKTIGLVGGISPQSTLKYYEQINNATQSLLGKHHSAKLALISVNFEEIVSAITRNAWSEAAGIILQSCLTLESCKVDYIALCSNTLHKVVDCISPRIQVPLIHILDPIIEIIKQKKYKRIGLIGTMYTMEDSFHKNYMSRYLPDIEIEVPDFLLRNKINTIIFDELCCGKLTDISRKVLNSTVDLFLERSVDAIILGCTELQLAFSHVDTYIPILDTTQLHADFLVSKANTEKLDSSLQKDLKVK